MKGGEADNQRISVRPLQSELKRLMAQTSVYRYFGTFRLLLASLVLLQHFLCNLAPQELALLARPFEIGSIAVLAFFSLSGFVIFEAADRIYCNNAAGFMINRLLRIVPQFLLAVIAAMLIYHIFDAVGTLRI